jgi:ABC-type multidrug transport system permease subunit
MASSLVTFLRNAATIGHANLLVFLKIRASYVWLFVVPVVFIGFMGFAYRDPGNPSNLRPIVLVENEDTNYLAGFLVKELGSQGMRVVEPSSGEEPEQRVRIPADFTQKVLSRTQSKVELLQKENTVSAEGAMIELRLLRSLIMLNSDLMLAAAQGGAEITEAAVGDARRAAPLVTLDALFAGRKPLPVGTSGSLPGNVVMFLMMNLLMFGGLTVSRQRQIGIIRRLACTPANRSQVVAGLVYGLILLGAVQVGVFLLAGRLLFKVNIGSNLGGLLVTLLIYAWVAASLGVLIGSVIHAEEKVAGLAILLSMLMAALGGCWWPIEICPPVMKVIAHCLPTGWALDALHQLISFGGTLAEAGKPIGVLASFGAVASLLAAWLFRW